MRALALLGLKLLGIHKETHTNSHNFYVFLFFIVSLPLGEETWELKGKKSVGNNEEPSTEKRGIVGEGERETSQHKLLGGQSGGVWRCLSGKQGLTVNTFFDVRGEGGRDSCTIQDSCISPAEVFHQRQLSEECV